MSLFKKLRRQLAPATIQDKDAQSGTAKVLAIVLFCSVVGSATLALTLAARPTHRFLKARKATKLLSESEALITGGNMEDAVKVGAEAYQLAPTDPSVIEHLAKIADEVGSGDAGFLWTQYERISDPSIESRAGVASLYITEGKLDAARQIISGLIVENGENTSVIRAAHLLSEADGDVDEALRHLEKLSELGELDDRRRLVYHIRRSNNEESEERWLDNQAIWDFAKRDDRLALQAIDYLIANPPSAESTRSDLMTVVNAHPEAGEERKIQVIRLQLEWYPERETEILESAIEERADLAPSNLYSLLQILAEKERFAAILDLVEPFENLLLGPSVRYKCDALASMGRWEEVQELVSSGDARLLPHQQSLYEAHIAIVFEEDLEKAGRKLEKALREAGEAYQPHEMLHVGDYGLQHGFNDLALRAFRTAATFESVRSNALASLHWAGRTIGSSDVVVEALETLCRHDKGIDYLGHLTYMQLIRGAGVEAAAGRASKVVQEYPESDLWRLNLALASFRFGDVESARNLAAACNPKSLEFASGKIARALGDGEASTDVGDEGEIAKRYSLVDAEHQFLALIEQERGSR